MPKPTKEQLASMRKLGWTEEEIADVIAYDNAVEKGEKTKYDLTDTQQKIAKGYTKADRKKTAPTVYKLDNTNGNRSRKENPTKEAIIAEIAQFLVEKSENACENVEIPNKGRQIAFTIGENSFELTLVQKRKPKN
jgi:hypothetical protein